MSKCDRCDDCHFIANDDEQSAWWVWETLPVQSALSVTMGLVKPIPCPDCNPDGKLSYIRPRGRYQRDEEARQETEE